MVKAKKIISNVILLCINIIILFWNILSHVILPNKNRKGNILFSLFSFLVGIVEKIFEFETSVFVKSWLLKNKFIKQGFILTAIFFFLISSFEWTATGNFNYSTDLATTIQVDRSESRSAVIDSKIEVAGKVCCAKPSDRHSSVHIPEYKETRNFLVQKRFLLFRIFRI
jgi:hypothetical protein